MQYVRSLGGSVSKTWNSINPATLSGAIDVIVVEQEDGSLACSPFHVRFGKFSLLRPYEKKVEFKVNDAQQSYSMKLGEGGEAFFVFETSDDIPESLQTSPVISPAASPEGLIIQRQYSPTVLQEPEYLDLNVEKPGVKEETADVTLGVSPQSEPALSDPFLLEGTAKLPASNDIEESKVPMRWTKRRAVSNDLLTGAPQLALENEQEGPTQHADERQTELTAMPSSPRSQRSTSPPPLSVHEAVNRAKSLSEKLSTSNIPSRITDSGDLMLDMTGYKSSDEEALRAEVVARKILAEELEGSYDIGALIGADEKGNLWIYSSEEAKEAASRKLKLMEINHPTSDAISDPGYHSDEESQQRPYRFEGTHQRARSEFGPSDTLSLPSDAETALPRGRDATKNYAKTLRLTSDQLKALHLQSGPNTMSFSVNRSTCHAFMYYWSYNVPIVISDIDGTITKSDALGHVLNMIGRDWTHAGVAKLYTDIVSNGYHILYLTSRSVGQADTTRAYLNGVLQDGFKLPKGPVIMSPDRTIAALRREIYLRKPEVFKMACLRDILYLFGQKRNPFYAGFGNRLTDALSYRSVNIPSTRIFTINSNAEVSLDLLTLNKYRSSYVTMREIVDQFFPSVGLLLDSEGEAYTDFKYWREDPLNIEDFLDSDIESNPQTIQSEDKLSDTLESDDDTELGDDFDDRENDPVSYVEDTDQESSK